MIVLIYVLSYLYICFIQFDSYKHIK